MSKVSTARKIGIVAQVAAQVASKQAGRSRTFNALKKGAIAGARAWGRVLRQLWLEVMGVVFLAMAGIGGVGIAREYGKYQASHNISVRLMVATCFTLTFAWFGVSSFWKVRKKG